MSKLPVLALVLAAACGSGHRSSDQRVVRKQIESVSVSRLAVGGTGGTGGIVTVNEPAFVLHSIEGKACAVSYSEYYAAVVGRNFYCEWKEP